MNRTTPLFQSPVAQILCFDHPPGEQHEDGEPEVSDSCSISFVEAGRFSVARKRESWDFGPNDVLLNFTGDLAAYRHDLRVPPSDVCLSVHFSPEVVEQALGARPNPANGPKIRASGATMFQKLRIDQTLQNHDVFATESAALDLIRVFLEKPHAARTNLSCSRNYSDYSRKVARAMDLMKSEFARPLSLSELSRQSAMSAFHFGRVFKALCGLSPHQFLLRIRLDHAAWRLREGDRVTDAAFACGFENLSHFIRTFRNRFGMPPAGYRARFRSR